MAHLSGHLSQAEHNESLARRLANQDYRDWAITACFYAVIHYAEARLFLKKAKWKDKHCATSMPKRGQWDKHTKHTLRLDCIKDWRSAHNALKKLMEKCEITRYLAEKNPRAAYGIKFLSRPAYEVFGEREVQGLIDELSGVRNGLKVDLMTFISGLGMYGNPGEVKDDSDEVRLITHWILRFETLANFLCTGKSILQKNLSSDQVEDLEDRMEASGYHFTG